MRAASPRRALTLLEVTISVALMALLLAALLTFFWQTVRLREDASRAADRVQLAQHVLERIEAELRGCLGMETLGFLADPVLGGQRLMGDRRSITFLTTALPPDSSYHFYRTSESLPPAQHDLVQVSYSLWIDQEKETDEGEPVVGGMIRTEKKTLNQFLIDEEDPLDLRHDLWSHELGYLEFRYFDGVEWDTKWEVEQGNSLPQLVMITIGFEPITRAELDDTDLDNYPLAEYPLGSEEYRPDRYSVIVRMPAADKFFGSRIQRVGKQMTEQVGVEGVGQ